MTNMGTFAGIAIALYAAHHVGDFWIQTDHQATHKGNAGREGALACLGHVLTYVLTQGAFVLVTLLVTGGSVRGWSLVAGLAISGITHYAADRREQGIMFAVARLTGKAGLLKIGAPRPGRDDNPSLGTGALALDQSWHIALGVFVPALIVCI